MNKIKISGTDQFMHENLTWERALDFYKQENAYLKTRLSQVVDNNTDKSFVDVAERFFNRFLITDEEIKVLQELVRSQKDSLKRSDALIGTGEHILNDFQKKLRVKMERFEKTFSELKNQFNKKLISFLNIS